MTLRTRFCAVIASVPLLLALSGCGGSSGSSTAAAYVPEILPQPAGSTYSYVWASSAAGLGGSREVNGKHYAQVWQGDSFAPVDAHDPDYEETDIEGGDGVRWCGYGSPAGLAPRALVWESTGTSAIDLHFNAFEATSARAISGTTVVGIGSNGVDNSALVWTLPSVLPTSLGSGFALGTQSGWVAGASQTAGGLRRAKIWRLSDFQSFDLHPPTDADESVAWDTNGAVTVGEKFVSGSTLAVVWNGTSATPTVLPSGGQFPTRAKKIRGSIIIGELAGNAALWLDNGATFVDLHEKLNGLTLNGSAVEVEGSDVRAIAPNGDVYGSIDVAGGFRYPVVWRRNGN